MKIDIDTKIERALKPMKLDIENLSQQVRETSKNINAIAKTVEKINIVLNGDGIYSQGLVKDIRENSNYVQNAQAKGFKRRITSVCEHYERWLSEGKWDKLDDIVTEKKAKSKLRSMTGISNVASAMGFIISLVTLLKLFGVI